MCTYRLPMLCSLQLQVDDVHRQRPNLVVSQAAVKLREGAEDKEDGQDVDAQVHGALAVVPEHSSECGKQGLVADKLLDQVHVPEQGSDKACRSDFSPGVFLIQGFLEMGIGFKIKQVLT